MYWPEEKEQMLEIGLLVITMTSVDTTHPHITIRDFEINKSKVRSVGLQIILFWICHRSINCFYWSFIQLNFCGLSITITRGNPGKLQKYSLCKLIARILS